MTTINLNEPYLEGAVRSTNFFNGRLLTSEDLQREQAASRARDERLGLGVGPGVVFGLEVAATAGANSRLTPKLTLQPGLAIDGTGHTMALKAPVDISLIQTLGATGAPAAAAGAFGTCTAAQAGVSVAGNGVFLLVMAPVEVREGRALASESSNCSAQSTVDSVRFRLVRLNLAAADLNDGARLRSRVAYLCFGLGDPRAAAAAQNPFAVRQEPYGLLDDLRARGGLASCDVPLAVLHWNLNDGIRFVDMWSVRRRPTMPPAGGALEMIIGDRLSSEREALFRQFQHHIQELLRDEPALHTIAAPDRFLFLPPVGIVPMRGEGIPRGLDLETFFGHRPVHGPVSLEADSIGRLAEEARRHAPVLMSSGEAVRLYSVWENVQAVNRGDAQQLVLVFTSRAFVHEGVARFNDARWSVSRFV